jgi:hypothetical protein
MLTKKPPEEAQPGSQKHSSTNASLRPLLPKKGWEPLKVPLRARRKNRESKLRLIKGCSVPSREIPDCTLRTHVRYRYKFTSPSASTSSFIATASDVSDDQGGRLSRISNLNMKPRSSVSPLGLPRNILHGLEGLPDSIGETPVFRRLFHEFFSRIFDRICTLLNPPPLDPAAKQACLALAMISPAYCLNAIASVENDAVMRRKGTGRDPTGAMLYGKVMSILRKQIAQLATAEIDNLLMIICTLAVFELVHNNVSNLDLHRQGMIQLVNKAGGVHNLGRSLPIVLNLDRIVAIYSGELPAFAQMIDRGISRPIKYPEVYGSFFKIYGRASLDQDICDFCCDVSRALELFEGAQISFDPATAKKIPNNDVFYFYFSRQRVADHFTLLHHRWWSQPSRSRCVLLATKILDYVILVDNYINVIPEFLASKIKETLESLNADAPDTWKGQEDILIWILFVLVTVPEPFSTNDWALEPLIKLLITKYNGFSGPLSWPKKELQSMTRFVWCSSRLDGPFLHVCCRLADSSSILKASEQNRVDELVDSGCGTD